MAPSRNESGQPKGSAHSISTPRVSRGGFFPPFSLPDNKMSGKYFGGVSILPNGSVGKTQIISPRGALITPQDNISPRFAHSYPGGYMQACADIATRLSGAAGKIWIELCRCDKTPPLFDHQTASHHPKVTMSGFWIQGGRFVTSGHFLDILTIPELQHEKILTFQKIQELSASGRSKSVVSSEDKATNGSDTPYKPIHVYLSQLDEDSDLAIFQAYEHQAFGAVQPPDGLLPSDIVSASFCDQSQGGYTIGYYAGDKPIENLEPFDEQVLATFWPEKDAARPMSYFPVRYAGVTGHRDDSIRCRDVFEFPDFRTISVGELGSVALSSHKYSTFMTCNISGWFQSSGGMVGGFEISGDQQRLRPVVCGVFRGEEGKNNTFAAFTVEGINWLFNGADTKTKGRERRRR